MNVFDSGFNGGFDSSFGLGGGGVIPITYTEFGAKLDLATAGSDWYNTATQAWINGLQPTISTIPFQYTAGTNNRITRVFVGANGNKAAGAAKVGLYSMTATLCTLITTIDVPAHTGTGNHWVEIPVDVNLTSGVVYQLAIISNSGQWPEADDGVWNVSRKYTVAVDDTFEDIADFSDSAPWGSSSWVRPLYAEVEKPGGASTSYAPEYKSEYN